MCHWFTKARYKKVLYYFENIGIITNLTSIIIRAIRNMKIEIRFMPCMYFVNVLRGTFGSRFLMYKYSASCRKMPIKIDLFQS